MDWTVFSIVAILAATIVVVMVQAHRRS